MGHKRVGIVGLYSTVIEIYMLSLAPTAVLVIFLYVSAINTV